MSPHYWRCSGRYGLIAPDHLSFFPHHAPAPGLFTFDAFHVTFVLEDENAHVYYRELELGLWEAEGHTPWWDMERMGLHGEAVTALADGCAESLLALLGATLEPRHPALVGTEPDA